MVQQYMAQIADQLQQTPSPVADYADAYNALRHMGHEEFYEDPTEFVPVDYN